MPSPRLARDHAATALCDAAGRLHVAPSALTPPDYRAVRGEAPDGEHLPSELTIRLLFGSWDRACDAATELDSGTHVEHQVRDYLYGRPRR